MIKVYENSFIRSLLYCDSLACSVIKGIDNFFNALNVKAIYLGVMQSEGKR